MKIGYFRRGRLSSFQLVLGFRITKLGFEVWPGQLCCVHSPNAFHCPLVELVIGKLSEKSN